MEILRLELIKINKNTKKEKSIVIKIRINLRQIMLVAWIVLFVF